MFNPSIRTKFSILFLLIVVMLGVAAYRIIRRIHEAQITAAASAVADDVSHFGRWVEKFDRVWVTGGDGGYLEKKDLVDFDALLASGGSPTDQDSVSEFTTTYYSKNPMLAQRELSGIASASNASAKFRLASLNAMNPVNQPDAFESEALRKMAGKDLGFVDGFDPRYGVYRYARKITMKKACITCHGDPSAAPRALVTRYGDKHGFGYRVGDVAGVISVTLPLESFPDMLRRYVDWKDLVLVLCAFALALAFLEYRILKPLKRLSDSAREASVGTKPELDVVGSNVETADEIQQLGFAIKRLHVSMRIAIDRMKRG